MTDTIQLYTVFVGVLAAVGVLYLGYTQQFVAGYRRFRYFLVAGLLVFAVGGPLADIFLPSAVHAVHGFAALFVVLGLYDPVHNDLEKDEWTSLLLREPSDIRRPGAWMVPTDDEILELFHSSELVLTPAIIAYNIERSREQVNRRLTQLDKHGLVSRVDRGKYRITPLGERYLEGAFDGATA